ncbi:MAG: A/G-specific adenine glycosylase [Rhodospirillaceae bacterium]|nr:A/G-specific adenine glycosylase [Rhodospirillaceae bacterium]
MHKPPDILHNRHIPTTLLNWYASNQRKLPWRSTAEKMQTPYRIWLSEIMLQQTQVATVIPYFLRFIDLWPQLQNLAEASLEEVLTEWAGLGYYARARNMHKCAQIVTEQHDGQFPDSEAELVKLPGIGPYTAAAITAIAFDKKATPLDGNFERVTARLFGVNIPIAEAKPLLQKLANQLTPEYRPGDYAQAVMDLGATICIPKKPKCNQCPLHAYCHSLLNGQTETIPITKQKKTIPQKYGTAFLLTNPSQEVLIRRRSITGLLGGMMEIPSTEWTDVQKLNPSYTNLNVTPSKWVPLPGRVNHVFTHFKLELKVMIGHVQDTNPIKGHKWHPLNQIDKAGLPKVMLKIIKHAFEITKNNGQR